MGRFDLSGSFTVKKQVLLYETLEILVAVNVLPEFPAAAARFPWKGGDVAQTEGRSSRNECNFIVKEKGSANAADSAE